jgi:tetratricopeptide (TPR) repeat protein
MSDRDSVLTDLQLERVSRELNDLPDAPVGSCLQGDELIDCAAGASSSEWPRDLDAHLASCPSCAERLARLFDAAEPWLGPRGDTRLQELKNRLLKTWIDVTSAAIAKDGHATVAARPWRLLAEWRWAIVAVTEAAVIVVLAVGLSYQYGRSAERNERAQFENEINAGFQDLGRLMTAVVNHRDDEVLREASRLRVVSLPGAGSEIYPYPTLTQSASAAAGVAAGLVRYPDLRTEYDRYAQQWSEALLSLSDLLVQTGKVDEASSLFEYMHRRDPGDLSLVYALTELLKLGGNHQRAINLYEEAIPQSIREQDPRPYHFAGYSYFELGEFSRALECYEKALAIYPDYAKVFYNEGLVYLRMPDLEPAERQGRFQERVRRALDLTLKAYGVEGDQNPRITFTLAILYSARKDWDKALDFLESSFKREKTYPIRARTEGAFEFFRDPANGRFHKRFNELIESYQPVSTGQFGVRLGRFSPAVFSE